MSTNIDLLSDIIVHTKYARYLPTKKRRETYEEIVKRSQTFFTKKYPHLKREIHSVFQFVYEKKVLPSMRMMQFAGKPVELNPVRLYNCSFMNVTCPDVFWETMFLLLSGTGVGYSVQYRHVAQMPGIRGPKERTRRHVVGDSIEGWADAVKVLVRAYFEHRSAPIFDYSDIREKGALLITSGGRAPGPQPLKDCIHNLRKVLDQAIGRKLTTIETHDMMCYIADAVLAGGIRRAALISLFSLEDVEMLHAKHGNWWETNPQRGRANNSVVLDRNRISEEEFKKVWDIIKLSGAGEPGFYFTNNVDWGTNPCCEIALKDMQFCNLTEINVSDVKGQDDFEERAYAATALGTLQASCFDFHYLREGWSDRCEEDALLGVSMTGIASGKVDSLDLRAGVELVRSANKEWAEKLGINEAARLTCVKPSGTSSLVLGTSSGIHAWHDEYYLRRMRVGKTEAIYHHLVKHNPELLEDDFLNPSQSVLSIPVAAPKGAITRAETSDDFLARVKRISEEWVKPGHRAGDNTHNVSATVTVAEDQWENIGDWMWENRSVYNGLSVLPEDLGTYQQTPFESISKADFTQACSLVQDLDLKKVKEEVDNTERQAELACAGGVCEIV